MDMANIIGYWPAVAAFLFLMAHPVARCRDGQVEGFALKRDFQKEVHVVLWELTCSCFKKGS